MTDNELVKRAKAGDEIAYRTLYDRNVDRVFRLGYRMAGEEDVAKDLTQETFVRAFQRLDQFRGDAAFSTWLHSIAVSVGLNWLRTVDRHRKRQQALEDAVPRNPGTRTPDPGLKDRLEEAVAGLSEAQRTVFLMYDLEGFSHREIAEALDVAEGTSKARLSHARAQLREALGEEIKEYL